MLAETLKALGWDVTTKSEVYDQGTNLEFATATKGDWKFEETWDAGNAYVGGYLVLSDTHPYSGMFFRKLLEIEGRFRENPNYRAIHCEMNETELYRRLADATSKFSYWPHADKYMELWPEGEGVGVMIEALNTLIHK